MKCKILPAKNLYIPVLPLKQEIGNAHKLLFGLCKTCMSKLSQKCNHHKKSDFENKYDFSRAVKKCEMCLYYRNQFCNHSDNERSLIGTWSTIEIDKALENGYQLIKLYEIENFENSKIGLF